MTALLQLTARQKEYHRRQPAIRNTDRIKALEHDAAVIEDGFAVSQRDAGNAADDVKEWIEGLGY